MAIALIVADDPHTLDVLRIACTARGYQVVTETAGRAAIHTAASVQPHVVLLAVELSDMDSAGVVVALRRLTGAPIIALSAGHDAREAVRLLDAGADDYATLPFGIDELLARVRAAVRRTTSRTDDQRRGIVDTGSFAVDLDTKRVWRDGAEVHLTPTEWRVLELLVQHEGRLVSHRELLRNVWGSDHYADTHYVRVYVGQLRRKLEPEPASPRHLVTEPNQGYRFHAHRIDVR
ncbi:winged helix-turn-helix domain-containing protein [Actinophytocola sp. NPDC049390]|uniref:winged helix-turn-helix domain-containing protein n=1 Tax=Actinophytocola sp. NPDC049390 TaxID=3363894 RepID=UPI0037A17229